MKTSRHSPPPKDDIHLSPFIEGHWHKVKGRLKQTYGKLTDDDLLYREGREEELVGRLQKKLHKSRAEVEKILRKN